MSLENLNSKGLECYVFYNRFACNEADFIICSSAWPN